MCVCVCVCMWGGGGGAPSKSGVKTCWQVPFKLKPWLASKIGNHYPIFKNNWPSGIKL